MFDQKIRRIVSIGFFVSFVFFLFSVDVSSGRYTEVFADDKPKIGGATTGVNNANASTGKEIGNEEYTVTTESYFIGAFQKMLFGLIRFLAWLIHFCVEIINWTLTPAFVSSLLNNTGIYTGWSTVRDFLNIFFIFFLLFSAFSTIFQVSKYHIKSTWVMIVVMALLVNFSWPIARVIIDVSNVAMTQMVGTSKGSEKSGDNLMSQMGGGSNFAALLIGQEKKGFNIHLGDDAFPVLFLGLMTGFLFLITIGAIAVILVIRGIALAVLLVFASVGFTMAAFPTTRSFANQWWSALIKYAFIGPILLFTLILSVSVMKASGDAGFVSGAPVGRGDLANLTTTFMQFSVSIVLIWTGIIAASKLGDGASSMVVGKANAAAKWGGRKIKGQTWDRGAKGVAAGKAGLGAGVNVVKRYAGQKIKKAPVIKNAIAIKRNAQEKMRKADMMREKEAEEAISGARGASKTAKEDQVMKTAAAYDEKKLSISQAKKMAAEGDAAAVLYLQKKKELDVDTYKEFSKLSSGVLKNTKLMKRINNDMAKKNAHLVVQNEQAQISDDEVRAHRAENSHLDMDGARKELKAKVRDKRVGQLSAKQLNEQSVEFHQNADMQEGMAKMHEDILDETIKNMNNNQRHAWQKSSESNLKLKAR